MLRARRLIRFACLCVFLDLSLSLPTLGGDGDFKHISEGDLRSLAIQSVMPSYPARAKSGHITGVAVALVYLDEIRRVVKVELLQAPCPDIEEGVKSAVLQWRFPPPRPREPSVKLSGKLTFYFVRLHEQLQVLNPNEAPNIRSAYAAGGAK